MNECHYLLFYCQTQNTDPNKPFISQMFFFKCRYGICAGQTFLSLTWFVEKITNLATFIFSSPYQQMDRNSRQLLFRYLGLLLGWALLHGLLNFRVLMKHLGGNHNPPRFRSPSPQTLVRSKIHGFQSKPAQLTSLDVLINIDTSTVAVCPRQAGTARTASRARSRAMLHLSASHTHA